MTRRKTLSIGLKATVSVGLLIYVMARTDFEVVWQLLRFIDPIGLAAAALLTGFERVLTCYRWYSLLRAAGQRISFPAALRVFLVSGSLGAFTPGGLGADMLRVYAVSVGGKDLPGAASAIVADRILGFLSLLGVSLGCGFLALHQASDLGDTLIIIAVAAAITVATSVIVSSRPAIRILETHPKWPAATKLASTLQRVRTLLTNPWVLARGIFLSLAVQITRVLYIYCFAKAIDIQTPFIYFCIFIPLIFFLKQLPISINGIGLSQGLYVWFFGPRGMSAAQAFTLSTGMMLLGYVIVLIGGALYLLRGLKLDVDDPEATLSEPGGKLGPGSASPISNPERSGP